MAQERVLHFQRKLHEWASADAERRFHDLWNLVCDPATLVVAWSRVSRNRGSRTAGVDRRHSPSHRSAWRRAVPHRAARGAEGGIVPAAAGPGAVDTQTRRSKASPRDPNAQGPGGADGPQARHGADLRIGLLPVELRLPARPPDAGRDRRDLPTSRSTPTSGSWRRTSRRASISFHTASSLMRSGGGSSISAACARAVVPEGGRDDGDGPPRANGDGHPARRDRLATAREHRPLRARPPISGGLAGDEPLRRQTPRPATQRPSRPTGSSGTPMTSFSW